ncbi:uncharacterized protein LOC143840680 [Paroedura picta]|uniref:uncharacterized protein LOC143840680 n=1 Tax=Paroedura picta TaxID=143630 RepID=UPI004056EE06
MAGGDRSRAKKAGGKGAAQARAAAGGQEAAQGGEGGSHRRASAARAREAWAAAIPTQKAGGSGTRRGRTATRSAKEGLREKAPVRQRARSSPSPPPARGKKSGRPGDRHSNRAPARSKSPGTVQKGNSSARGREKSRGVSHSGTPASSAVGPGPKKGSPRAPRARQGRKSTVTGRKAAHSPRSKSNSNRHRSKVVPSSTSPSVSSEQGRSVTGSTSSPDSAASHQTGAHPGRSGNSAYYWRGYARAAEHFARKQSNQHGQSSSSPEVSSVSGSSGSEEAEQDQKKSRPRHKKHVGSGAEKRKRSARSSLSSGESTSLDEGPSTRREGWYWLEGAYVPGIPTWMHQRRVNSDRLLNEAGIPVEARAPPVKYTAADAPPGVHLQEKIRERALEGYYVDLFSLIKGQEQGGDTGSRRDRKRRKDFPLVERNFDNWMRGYTEYLTLIVGSYPERAWHLGRYQSHILEARNLAGDEAAMDYDRVFRELASQNEDARWDLKHPDTWMVYVGFSAHRSQEKSQQKGSGRRSSGLPCWDYNNKGCRRRRCRFDHKCEGCGGNHGLPACTRPGSQTPFRGARSSGKKDGGSGAAGPSTASKTA